MTDAFHYFPKAMPLLSYPIRQVTSDVTVDLNDKVIINIKSSSRSIDIILRPAVFPIYTNCGSLLCVLPTLLLYYLFIAELSITHCNNASIRYLIRSKIRCSFKSSF